MTGKPLSRQLYDWQVCARVCGIQLRDEKLLYLFSEICGILPFSTFPFCSLFHALFDVLHWVSFGLRESPPPLTKLLVQIVTRFGGHAIWRNVAVLYPVSTSTSPLVMPVTAEVPVTTSLVTRTDDSGKKRRQDEKVHFCHFILP